MRWGAGDGVGQRAAFHVRAAQGDRHGGVFIGCYRLGIGNRRIVHGIDGQADGCSRRIDLAVVGDELEAVSAGVVQRGGVGQVRGGAAERAVAGAGGHRVGQRVAIGV